MIGQTLGSCEILEKLGQGGMGEVWRARDNRLGREVALKLLPAEFANDPERMARFDREARTLASLHHPNVASLFGFEEDQGVHFLVMELVEGEELADRIARGPLPPDEVVRIAKQIALGLEAAHEKGITHRDLKPSNIRITPTGEVKILDFGLARPGAAAEPGADPATSPTITAAMTQQGVILGTAAYMSPEQARGQAVDARADVWAFGVIVWEMLRGRRLFDGDTMSDTLAGVLKSEIDTASLPASTPRALRRVLERCLERDPRQRLHSIADARIELERPASADSPERRSGGSSRAAWILAAVLAVVAALLALRPSGAPRRVPLDAAVSILLPEDASVMLGDWPALDVSPDGSTVAVTASVDGRPTIMVRQLGDRAFHSLTRDADAFGPCFSPDGRWIAFFQSGLIRKIAVGGGSPVDIAPMSYTRGMSWGDDGYLYYAPAYATGIHRAPDTGSGPVEVVTVLDSTQSERTHRWPEVLPGGRGVIFTSGGADSPGDYENARIMVYDARSGETRYLGVNGAMARYSNTGHLLVGRQGTLYSYDFDLGSASVRGGPIPVHEGIADDSASGLYSFALTRDSDLFYIAAHEGQSLRTLAWVDRDGEVDPLDLPAGPYRFPRLDSTGERVVLVLGEGHGGNDDVYLLDLPTLDLTRLSFDRGSILPLWAPDDRSILFQRATTGGEVMRRQADGNGAAEVAVDGVGVNILSSISPSGDRAFYTRLGGPKLGAITTSEIRPDAKIDVAIDTPAAEWAPVMSPDGKWLAYVSDETGREEIYVQPWPLTGGKYQVSVDGGRGPLWSSDGKELFFSLYDRMLVAEIDTSTGFRASRPQVLFTTPLDNAGIPMRNYAIMADGSRFLVVRPDQSHVSRTVQLKMGFARTLDAAR